MASRFGLLSIHLTYGTCGGNLFLFVKDHEDIFIDVIHLSDNRNRSKDQTVLEMEFNMYLGNSVPCIRLEDKSLSAHPQGAQRRNSKCRNLCNALPQLLPGPS